MKSRYALAGCALALLVLTLGATAVAQEKEEPPASIKELQAALKRDPANPKLYVSLGLAYWDQDDDTRALQAFQRAVRVGPRSAEAHNWLGVALSKKADLPGAVGEFKRAVALDPKYGRAYTNLGSALAQSGDFAEAVEVFEKALLLEPNNLAAHMNLGLALRDKGDLEAALTHLRLGAAADEGNAGIHYELAQTLRQRGDLPEAIAAFERALAIDPELREGYYGLGLALKQQAASRRTPSSSGTSATSPADDLYTRAESAVAQGDLNVAREHLTEALRLDENHPDARNLLGFILGQQGDLSSALAHLERAIALRPESAASHYNLGVALWYSRSKERALTELRESVRLDPSAGASHAFLGTALRENGDLTGARVSLQRAIALLPPTAAVYIDLGITYLRAGDSDKALGQFEAGLNLPSSSVPAPDWEGAVAALRGALTANADNAQAHNVLGLLLGRHGAASDAVAVEFREAIRLRPDFAEAHNHLGLVLVQAGDDEAGIVELRQAVRIDSDYADAHANLGAALTPADAEEAIRELEKAVALAPRSVNAQFNLAVAYGASRSRGAGKEIEQLRKAIELAPTFARARLTLGKALLQEAKVPDAIVELQEAVRLERNSGEAHYQLGLALARDGRKEEAAAELRKGRVLVAADDRDQTANLDIAEGRAALEKGDFEQAVMKFRHAIQLKPESPEAQRFLATVLEKPAVSAADASAVDDRRRVAEFENDIRAGRYKEVETRLADYVKEHPASSWGWYALGYSLFAEQKIGESIQALAKSLELDIRNAEAHKILGRDLMIIGRFDAAQVEFEQGIRYQPDAAEIHYNLGKLFSIQDNWEPARKAFEAALRIAPSYIEALDALGFALEALGNDAAAVAKYEQAMAVNESRHGSFASAHTNLSAYYNRTGNAERALDYARQAIELDPKSDRAWFQKARAEERQGRLNDAVDSVARALGFNSRASSYYYVLAGLYRRLGKMEESQKALESFTRLEQETTELEKMRRAAIAAVAPPPREGRE
jgi:tetratricopeptide (TPR) repeat protein